ncbi:AP2 domain-containing protein [candidate division KSB1 bacterium]|nr:AP2 domain-containing protein [candidate division KSB1 bacterium]
MAKSISRIDQEERKTHGFFVRVCFNKKIHSKFFSDKRCGGRHKALMKAQAWRNEMESKLGKPRTDRVIVAREKTTSVRRALVSRGSKAKTKGLVYEVTYSPEPNKICRTSFSIKKYGEEGAKKMALEFRKQKELEMYGKTIGDSPKTRKSKKTNNQTDSNPDIDSTNTES